MEGTESFGVDLCSLSGQRRRLAPLCGSTSLLYLAAQAARLFGIPVAELCTILGDRALTPSDCRRSLAELGLGEGSTLTILRDATTPTWPAVMGQELPCLEPCCRKGRRSRSFDHLTRSDREWQHDQLSGSTPRSSAELRAVVLDTILGNPAGGAEASPAADASLSPVVIPTMQVLQVGRRRGRPVRRTA